MAAPLPLLTLRAEAAGGPFPPLMLRARAPFAEVLLGVSPASFSAAGLAAGPAPPSAPFVADPLPLAVCTFAALAGVLLSAPDFNAVEPAPGLPAPLAPPPEAA